MIVELKRYSVTVDVDTLVEQGGRYYKAMYSILEKLSREDERIEVVFVLGKKPTAKNAAAKSAREYITDRLENVNGRYVLYDELIENASRQYEDYLTASKKSHKLDDVLAALTDTDADS